MRFGVRVTCFYMHARRVGTVNLDAEEHQNTRLGVRSSMYRPPGSPPSDFSGPYTPPHRMRAFDRTTTQQAAGRRGRRAPRPSEVTPPPPPPACPPLSPDNVPFFRLIRLMIPLPPILHSGDSPSRAWGGRTFRINSSTTTSRSACHWWIARDQP